MIKGLRVFQSLRTHRRLQVLQYSTLSRIEKVPSTIHQDTKDLKDPYRAEFSQEKCDARRRWIEGITNGSLSSLDGWWGPNADFDEEYLVGNIEAAIGTIRIPVGVIGPIEIHGKHTEGIYMVPAATTEGALLASANRGSKALNLSGGVKAYAFRQRMQCTPMICCEDPAQAERLNTWIKGSISRLREVIGSVSRKARLITIDSVQDAEVLYVFFVYETGEAAGQNMTTVATTAACRWIKNQVKHDFVGHEVNITEIIPETYLSGDKRMSALNALLGRGVSVTARAYIPEDILRNVLKTDSRTMESFVERIRNMAMRQNSSTTSVGNVPNILAAIFASTGQDLGCVPESSQSFLCIRKSDQPGGGIEAQLDMPTLTIGTVGGGTGLPTQTQCLEMMQCTGSRSNFRMAEIIASVCLAGDLSLAAAVATWQHAGAHEKLGRNRPNE